MAGKSEAASSLEQVHPHRANRTRKSRLGLGERGCRNTSPSKAACIETGQCSGAGGLGAGLFLRRRALNGHGDDLFVAEKDEAKGAMVFPVLLLVVLEKRRLRNSSQSPRTRFMWRSKAVNFPTSWQPSWIVTRM